MSLKTHQTRSGSRSDAKATGFCDFYARLEPGWSGQTEIYSAASATVLRADMTRPSTSKIKIEHTNPADKVNMPAS